MVADGGRWREHQGAYPVVMLSLKEVVMGSWELTRAALAHVVAHDAGMVGGR